MLYATNKIDLLYHTQLDPAKIEQLEKGKLEPVTMTPPITIYYHKERTAHA